MGPTHLNQLNMEKTTIYYVGNPGSGWIEKGTK
jgi:hypothetical protein